MRITIYEVQLAGVKGSFFTHRDPTDPETWEEENAGSGIFFSMVDRAVFNDSYQPAAGWKQKRERDAATAIDNGGTREMRINPREVAAVTTVEAQPQVNV